MSRPKNSSIVTPWKTNHKNFILEGDGFFISYNPKDREDEVDRMFGQLGILVGITTKDRDKEGPETAICESGKFEAESGFKSDMRYLILKGDWRKEYEEALPKGLEACLEVYERNKAKHRSDWSEDDVVKIA